MIVYKKHQSYWNGLIRDNVIRKFFGIGQRVLLMKIGNYAEIILIMVLESNFKLMEEIETQIKFLIRPQSFFKQHKKNLFKYQSNLIKNGREYHNYCLTIQNVLINSKLYNNKYLKLCNSRVKHIYHCNNFSNH